MHHAKGAKPEEYIAGLDHFDGSCLAGEDDAWMTIMYCCDSHQQPTSSTTGKDYNGDVCIPKILLSLSQELL
jgi:hypothetical protein